MWPKCKGLLLRAVACTALAVLAAATAREEAAAAQKAAAARKQSAVSEKIEAALSSLQGLPARLRELSAEVAELQAQGREELERKIAAREQEAASIVRGNAELTDEIAAVQKANDAMKMRRWVLLQEQKRLQAAAAAYGGPPSASDVPAVVPLDVDMPAESGATPTSSGEEVRADTLASAKAQTPDGGTAQAQTAPDPQPSAAAQDADENYQEGQSKMLNGEDEEDGDDFGVEDGGDDFGVSFLAVASQQGSDVNDLMQQLAQGEKEAMQDEQEAEAVVAVAGAPAPANLMRELAESEKKAMQDPQVVKATAAATRATARGGLKARVLLQTTDSMALQNSDAAAPPDITARVLRATDTLRREQKAPASAMVEESWAQGMSRLDQNCRGVSDHVGELVRLQQDGLQRIEAAIQVSMEEGETALTQRHQRLIREQSGLQQRKVAVQNEHAHLARGLLQLASSIQAASQRFQRMEAKVQLDLSQNGQYLSQVARETGATPEEMQATDLGQ